MNLAKKSCALDPTPTPLLIKCIDVFLPVLTKMANISLESRHFPSAWKKALHGMVPDYICKLISRRKSTGYSLRSRTKVMLEVPSCNILPTLGGRAFCYAATKLWNNLPSEISSLDSLSIFKCHVKTYLLTQAFNLK